MAPTEPVRVLPLLAVAAAVVLITSCTAPDGGGASAPTAGVRAVQADPIELVGMWRVVGAQGEGPDTWLRLEAGTYQLWRDCGAFVEGGWQAAGRAFVASDPYSALAACAVEGIPEVPWLRAAVAYESEGVGGWRLLDAAGDVVAGLRVDGAPEPVPDAAELYARAPEVTDEVRAALAGPVPLPDGLEPVTGQDLIGRWEPTRGSSTDPHVVFHDDGTWTGFDGCNGAGGSWAVDVDGRLLSTAGPQTMIACDGDAVPGDVARAARAGMVDGRLVLVDPDGTEITRLARG
ncbi:META domain-containing protein [Oerskovia enterophila]|uniref:META domain-containing protein n=1 Tax=Oerskovia enterophila TaxID=43678 RepID=UPI003808A3C2